MAKYKKRADGRFYTLVSTGKYTEDGRPIRIPVYGTSSRDLERKVGEIKTDLSRGTYADDKGMTLGVYARKWHHATKENCVAASTARDYMGVINNHFDLIENMKLMDLTKSDIMMQINKDENSDETKRRIILTIKQILESAIDDGLIYKNVARSIKAPSSNPEERRPLTDAEKKAIKECSFTPMEKVYVDILYCCGIRRGELLALQKNDINLKAGTITVGKSITFVGGSKIKYPKSKSGMRTIPIPDWLSKEMKEYLSSLDSLYLFHGRNKALISQSTAKRLWQSIFNKINVAMGGTPDIYKRGKLVSRGIHVTDVTPHIFRHNYATMLYYAGIDVKEAQKLLGHSSIKITLEIYTHLMDTPDVIKEKINCISL